MEILGNIFEWAVLLIILLGLIYTMIVIKEEKKSYIESAIPIDFKGFQFKVPSWWGTHPDEDNNEIIFKRDDTRYEWKATLTWIPISTDQTIEEKYEELVSSKKIEFDLDQSIIHGPSTIFRDETMKNNSIEAIRIEGTATQDQQNRLYYDAYLIKDKTQNGFLFAESKSSVLNGLVEGPYFEEVLSNIQRK